jgi:fluoride ion exporter CrcB/FEX
LLVPRWILEDWFGQPPYPDYSYVRVSGALSLTLGLFAVMVARRDDAWWWAWAFAIATGLCGTISTLHAALGLPEDAEAFLWLLFAVVSWILTAGLVVGITRASQEHPIS